MHNIFDINYGYEKYVDTRPVLPPILDRSTVSLTELYTFKSSFTESKTFKPKKMTATAANLYNGWKCDIKDLQVADFILGRVEKTGKLIVLKNRKNGKCDIMFDTVAEFREYIETLK